MTTYQDILDKLRQSQLMQKFNANKQAMTNPQPSGFGHGIANLGMKMSQSQIPKIAKLGVGTQTLGNKLGALGAAKGLGGASGMLGNAGAHGAASALGKATPFVGGAMSGAQAAQDASRGDYIGAGLNGVAAGASFVPGVGTVVAMGAQALDSINKMFRSAKDKANQQAMQKSMQEAQNSEQANAESTDQLQNQFANDSMQYANAMAQPSTYDDIMSRLQPVENLEIPTGFATDINLPNEEETLQDEPATFTGHVDQSNAAPQFDPTIPRDNDGDPIFVSEPQTTKSSILDKIKSGLSDFKSGYVDNSTTSFSEGDLANNISGNVQQPTVNPLGNAVAEARYAGFNQEQIDNMKQGLNGGNKDIAALIDKYNIRKPGTDEEIALAQAGNFNPDQVTGAAAPTQTKKSLMQRLGEAAGTGRRLVANPWVQAGIAAAISKADGGDVGDMAQAAYKYGTAKSMSDQYYRQLHPDAKVMPVLNTYGVDDYKAKAYNDFNQGRTVMSRRDLIKLQNPTMSDQDIEDLITKSGINGDELVSIKGYETVEKAKNNTRKTDIQEDKNKWQKDQGQQKIGIQQQNANTNATRVSETKRHNSVTEAQGAKRNEIAEKKLNNPNNNNKNTTTHTTSSGVKVEEGKVYTNVQGEEYVFMDGKWIKKKK